MFTKVHHVTYVVNSVQEMADYMDKNFGLKPQRTDEFTDRGLVVASQDSRLLVDRTRLEYQEGNGGQGGDDVERRQKGMERKTPGPTLDTVLLALARV